MKLQERIGWFPDDIEWAHEGIQPPASEKEPTTRSDYSNVIALCPPNCGGAGDKELQKDSWYHGTAGQNAQSILKDGLNTSEGGVVWVTKDLDYAMDYARKGTERWAKEKGLSDEQISKLPVAIVRVTPTAKMMGSEKASVVNGKIPASQIIAIDLYRHGDKERIKIVKAGVDSIHFVAVPPEILFKRR